MFNFDFKRQAFKGSPINAVRIPEEKAGCCCKMPEAPLLVSVIEKEIWIVETIKNDSFVCREPSVAELIRICEYLENPYIENNSVRSLGEI